MIQVIDPVERTWSEAMRVMIVGFMIAAASLSVAAAQVPTLKPALAPIGFLAGRWVSEDGTVQDTGGTARGSSTITAEAAGAVLLRRDHTELFDAKGKPTGGFDQIMMIYADGGSIHADYSDGDHLIHYVSAAVSPGRSVAFTSDAQPGAPVFRLRYELTAPDTLAVSFAMAPPGQSAFRPIATGVAHRAN